MKLIIEKEDNNSYDLITGRETSSNIEDISSRGVGNYGCSHSWVDRSAIFLVGKKVVWVTQHWIMKGHETPTRIFLTKHLSLAKKEKLLKKRWLKNKMFHSHKIDAEQKRILEWVKRSKDAVLTWVGALRTRGDVTRVIDCCELISSAYASLLNQIINCKIVRLKARDWLVY